MRRFFVLVIALAALVTGVAARNGASLTGQCADRYYSRTVVAEAEAILAGLIDAGPFDPAPLGTNLTWLEDPYNDANWRYRLHSMKWLEALREAFRLTGDSRYFDGWRRHWIDWLADNPVAAPPSEASWNHHTTGLRAKILACAAVEHPGETWIRPLLADHAKLLALDDFYVGRGNHALNQVQGLLAAACVLGDANWLDLALDRIDPLAEDSILADGATNEGSVSYALYNFERYQETVERIEGCGANLPRTLSERLPLLARFIAHATMPNGEIPLIGDSNVKRPGRWYSDEVAYAVSLGSQGTMPDDVSVLFEAGGWAFGRTSWAPGAMPDAVAYALRTGHASDIHAHSDQGHLSIFGYGHRLLEDSGLHAYTNPLNQYFYAPQAHNVIVAEGARYRRKLGSQVVASAITPEWDLYELNLPVWKGVRWTRRVFYARKPGWFLVDDRLESAQPRRFTQLWHLAPGSDPLIDGDAAVRTRYRRGNLSASFLAGSPDLSVVTGRTDPMQGFIALEFGDLIPTPVIEATSPGVSAEARFVTLLATHERSILPQVDDLFIEGDAIAATITVGPRVSTLRWVGDEAELRCIEVC